MSTEVNLKKLVGAHEGLSDLIKTFEPERGNNVPQDNTRLVCQHLDQSKPSTKVVEKFLEDVTALAATREELMSLLENLTSATMNKTSSLLTHSEILGRRVECCQRVEQHMSSVIENKDLLIYHLQQPLVTNFLTIHHQYHKDLIFLIGGLMDIINKLPSHISLLEEHAQNSVLQKSNSYISYVTRIATELRTTLEEVITLQTLVATVLVEQQ
ncbi:hypothetical protein Pmani_001866 [Petrolisthes manimaculis]|uniref:HAUS augmin-like complex subunit 2 n=1 Tax=Petrolisthes manimaculis TaxID=1843537 RepID=A0AAE1QJR2_9EUCA|nr:hypothetical protein Pmani_001866 [Petrolisthes manimaculis]